GGSDSLVERQLAAMLHSALWAPCGGCALVARCPIKHNVDSLRDPASGGAVRERVRRLFEVQHPRRRAHVTMPALRSALSCVLLPDRSCENVAHLWARKDEEITEDLAQLYYPNAFADLTAETASTPSRPAHPPSEPAIEERAVDRLVRRLREVDV